ncbi:MAG TPA: hypothetical protein PLV41_08255 [Miltoncostaeales bacterium]|jgi:hypothetical protein|nr:hypothetical protein [Miltoncostaeales bacterium]
MAFRRTPVVAALLVGLLLVSVAASRWGSPTPPLTESLQGRDRLVSNEYAMSHPEDASAVASRIWLVTSGSLFVRNGVGYSGAATRGTVDARSTQTNSAALRAVTRQMEPADVALNMRMRLLSLVPGDGDIDSGWDGFHTFVRYRSVAEFYLVSAAARDGFITIRRKRPGGESNGGHYVALTSARFPWQLNRWYQLQVRTMDTPQGVRLMVFVDGRQVLDVTDTGFDREPPIRGGGRIGIRGDNAEFEIADVGTVPCTEIAASACGQ